jgi:predicted O-methyltransferase YrrM
LDLTSIEVNPDSAGRARGNIEKAGLAGKITVITGNAISVIPKLGNIIFDLVFIDAGKSEYRSYLNLAEDKLRRGGIVFADNVKIFASQMGDYLDYVRNSGKYRSEYIDVGFDCVEISTKLD